MRLLVVLTIITTVIAIPVNLREREESGNANQEQQPGNADQQQTPDNVEEAPRTPPSIPWHLRGITWDSMPVPDNFPGWRPQEHPDPDSPNWDRDLGPPYRSGANNGRMSFEDFDPAQITGDALNTASNGLGSFAQLTGLDKLVAPLTAAGAALGLSQWNPLPANSPAGGNN